MLPTDLEPEAAVSSACSGLDPLTGAIAPGTAWLYRNRGAEETLTTC